MYTVTGSNLHGQWLETNPVLSGFQTLKNRGNCGRTFELNQCKLTHISWSYNIFQKANKFYLSGSYHRNTDQLIEVPLPKEYSNCQDHPLLLTGNEQNLFLCDINLHTMCIINLEDYTDLKRVNLFTETLVAGATKRIRRDDAVLKVCVTNFNCIFLTRNGRVYRGALPSPVDTSMCSGNICDIQCGYEHSLLLTDTGQVYSWGNGRRLQLGHGNLNNIEAPVQIEALAGVHIKEISAGGWHSLALSEFGDVYAWGWNDTGQLGIKDISGEPDKLPTVNSYAVPTLVDVYDENCHAVNMNVKKIACGSRHSAIILEDNSVWTTGCNKYGQTGFSPGAVKRVNGFKKSYQCAGDISVKCGPWVTVIVNSG